MGDFIWQEIKNLPENPQKICSYSPYIMYMIEKVKKAKFPRDVQHKPLRPPVNKTPTMPSPPLEEPVVHEQREEERQQQQQSVAAQVGTGLDLGSTFTHRGPPLP